MISIRRERLEDIPRVREINRRAFRQPVEASIVDKLRQNCDRLVSLVAVDGGAIVGHVLFSPVVVEGCQGTISGIGLAPMAVAPERQHQDIGSALIE